MVSLAQENAIGTEPRARESGILDENALQSDDFVKCERVFAGLQDRAAPSLKAVPRGTFAFDLEASAAVGRQQEACGASDQMGACSSHGFPCLRRQV